MCYVKSNIRKQHTPLSVVYVAFCFRLAYRNGPRRRLCQMRPHRQPPAKQCCVFLVGLRRRCIFIVGHRPTRAPASSTSGPAAASSSATHQAAPAPSSSATGPAAAPSSATGQAARTQRQSASAHAAQALAAHAGTVPVVAIGNAIVQCAKAVRDAGLLGVDEAGDAGGAAPMERSA